MTSREELEGFGIETVPELLENDVDPESLDEEALNYLAENSSSEEYRVFIEEYNIEIDIASNAPSRGIDTGLCHRSPTYL